MIFILTLMKTTTDLYGDLIAHTMPYHLSWDISGIAISRGILMLPSRGDQMVGRSAKDDFVFWFIKIWGAHE